MNAICQADVMDDKGRLQASNLRAPVTPPNTKIYPMSRGRTTEVGGLPFPPYKLPFELLLQKAPLSRLPSNQHWKRRGRAEDGDGRKYEVEKGGRPLHRQPSIPLNPSAAFYHACKVQGSAKRRSPGLVKFVAAFAFALPAAFSQPGDHLSAEQASTVQSSRSE